MKRLFRRFPASEIILKAFSILSLNLALLFAVDRIFGCIVKAPPVYLNKRTFDYDSYATNPRGYFDVKGERDGQTYFTIDRSRERDRRHGFSKIPKGAVTIVAIGDSFTYGQGVKLKDTFIKRLERARSSRPVYGLDYAVPGADIRGVVKEFNKYFSDRPRPTPSLIIYGYVLNDPFVDKESIGKIAGLEENDDPDDELRVPFDLINLRTNVIHLLRGPRVSLIASHSRIVEFALAAAERERLSRRAVQYYLDIHDPEKNGRGISRTLDAIKTMNDSAKKSGSRFVVAIFPIFYKIDSGYPFLKTHAFLSKELTARGVDVVDLYPGYAGRADEDLWVHPVDQHPNELAQKIAAEQIERWIRRSTRLLN
jgi:hypothetical protein